MIKKHRLITRLSAWPLAALVALFAMQAMLAANPAAKHAAFTDAVAGDPPRAKTMLEAMLANPEDPAAAGILRSALLTQSSTLRELVFAAMPNLPLTSKLAVHGALADLGDSALEAELRALADTGDMTLRLLTVPMFGGVGTEASLPFMLKQMDQGNATLANAAASAIARMQLPGVDVSLAETARSGSGQARLDAIRLIALRNPPGAERLLFELTQSGDSDAVTNAALAGLARIGGVETGRQLLGMILRSSNAAEARPYQAAFRRLAPRFAADTATLWAEGFLPAWEAAASAEIRRALLLMVPALRGAESGDFLVGLIRAGGDYRDDAIAQLRSWNQWDAADYMLAAATVQGLSDSQQAELFRLGAALLSPQVRANENQKKAYAQRLLQAAPNTSIRQQVQSAISDANITP